MKKSPNHKPVCVCAHQVSHVVHGQLVGVKSNRGLQVVHANQPQVALPQLPAAAVLHLETEQSAQGQRRHTAKLATFSRRRALAAYL